MLYQQRAGRLRDTVDIELSARTPGRDPAVLSLTIIAAARCTARTTGRGLQSASSDTEAVRNPGCCRANFIRAIVGLDGECVLRASWATQWRRGPDAAS